MAATQMRPLGWLGIVRLGLVQTALGAIVILTTSTLNRVMVVELMLPAMLPGILVGIHYAVQLSRPRWGYGSDMGGRRTPWIIGGMAVLALGGIGAALSVALMASSTLAGIILATLAFIAIGVGVGASGTSLLTLLAVRVIPERRAPAATIVWVMMIVGFILTAAIAGGQLDPFTMTRLVAVTSIVCALAFVLTLLAVIGLEGKPVAAEPARSGRSRCTQAILPAGYRRGLAGAQGTQFLDFRFRLNACLLHAGPHPRTLCRRGLRLFAGCIDTACRHPAWWRSAGHDHGRAGRHGLQGAALR
jgi:MFS family permease